MLEIKILLSQDHFMAFNLYHSVESPAGKKGVWSFRGLYCAICFAFIMFFYFTQEDMAAFNQKSILVIIVAFLAIIFSKKIMLFSVKSNIKRLAKNGKLPFPQESTLLFADELICEKRSNSESQVEYTLVEQIVLRSNAIYIYFGAVQAFIIPNESFQSPEERQHLLELLKAKTNITPK